MIRQNLIEIYRYRALLKNLVSRDLTVRYKRSVIGFIWTMINPLVNTIVLTIVFSTIFRLPTKDFVVYFLSGFLLWNFFRPKHINELHAVFWEALLYLKRFMCPRVLFFP